MEEPTAPAFHADGVALEPADPNDALYRPPPAGFRVRRPTDADLAGIAALYERAARRGPDGTTGRGALRTESDLRRTWVERRNDALLVESEAGDAQVVGYLEFHETADPWTPSLDLYAEGRVDPDTRDRGVGAFLLGRARDRAARAAARHADVATRLRTTVVDPTADTLAWFVRRGMAPVRHMLQLRLDLDRELPTPSFPARVHPVVGAELPLPALHGVLVSSFADHHLGVTEDLELWRTVAVERGRVDLSVSPVAVDEDGTLLGLALARVGSDGEPGLGVISDLGVVPDARGGGLATALLRETFRRLADAGADRVGLEVDDVTMDGALRLYQRAGMDIVHHTVVLASDEL